MTLNIVGSRRVGLTILETADLLGFPRTAISRVYGEWSGKEKIFSAHFGALSTS